MSPHLIDLQPELQLLIADALGPDYTGLHDDDVQPIHDSNGQHTLSRDSKCSDRESESQRNILNWSCTSKYFRQLLASYVFKIVTLRNTEKSGASLDTISEHPEFGKHVREVRFVGYAPGDARREDPAFGDCEHILPQRVEDLLSDLRRFPNLETLSVEFNHDFDDYNEWKEEGTNQAAEVENMEEIRQKEGEEAWRALMLKVWDAVCLYDRPAFRKLAIKRLYHREVSKFTTAAFHKFLSNLEDFSLSIFESESDDYYDWNINICEVRLAFVARLDEFFFNHLQRITSLTLKAAEKGPIGLDGPNHTALELRKEHMPHLKTVHLENIFVSPELRDFLLGHVGTLEELHLHGCLAETDTSMAEDGLHWHELFDAIASAGFTELRTFEVTQEPPAPLPKNLEDCEKDDSKLVDEDEETLTAQMTQARNTVKHGEKRVWAHAVVNGYGVLSEDKEENFRSFREGRDQEAFERLMSIIERNTEAQESFVH